MVTCELKMKQKNEAIKRMKMLGLSPDVISALEEKDVLFYSEDMGDPLDAILFSLGEINSDTHNYKVFENMIREMQEKYNAFPYHGQLSHTEDGEAFMLLYVSAHEDEWEMEIDDITLQEDPYEADKKCCFPIVYCKCGPFTEFGSVKIVPSLGGICRRA